MTAASYSPRPAPAPAPAHGHGHGHGHRTTTSAVGPKLRDSCHACASSKVKCSKDKPTCSRCARRGTLCEYFVTKRPGRRHSHHRSSDNHNHNHSGNNRRGPSSACSSASSSSSGPSTTVAPTQTQTQIQTQTHTQAQTQGQVQTQAGTASLPDAAPWPPPSLSTDPGTDFLASPDLMPSSSGQGVCGGDSSDMFPNLLPSVDSSLSSVLTTLSTDFDDFLASPRPFPMPADPCHVGDDAFLRQVHVDPCNDNNNNGNGRKRDSTPRSCGAGAGGLDSGASSTSIPNSAYASASSSSSAIPEDDTISVFGRAASDLSSLHHSNLQSPSDPRRFFPTTEDGHGQSFSCAAASHGCCMSRALDLLKDLIPPDLPPCTFSNDQHNHQHHQQAQQGNNSRNICTSRLPTVQDVLERNKQTVEAIGNMLQCSCRHDVQLPVIMSLIVFKVLDWYTAAAHPTPAAELDGMTEERIDDGSHSPMEEAQMQKPSTCFCYCSRCRRRRLSERSERAGRRLPTVVATGGSCGDEGEEDSQLMAAQMVLGQLHRVQQFINQLSPQLNVQHRGRAASIAAPGGASAAGMVGGNPAMESPVRTGPSPWPAAASSSSSAIVLDQLEPELGRRLSTLSLAIINMLRRD